MTLLHQLFNWCLYFPCILAHVLNFSVLLPDSISCHSSTCTFTYLLKMIYCATSYMALALVWTSLLVMLSATVFALVLRHSSASFCVLGALSCLTALFMTLSSLNSLVYFAASGSTVCTLFTSSILALTCDFVRFFDYSEFSDYIHHHFFVADTFCKLFFKPSISFFVTTFIGF